MGLYSMQNQPHQPQGEQTTPQQTQYSRPASVVQPQHAQAPPPQQHPGFPSTHSISSVYQTPGNQSAASQQSSDGLPYYTPTAYNANGATSGYSSAGMCISRQPRRPHVSRWILADATPRSTSRPPQPRAQEPS